MNMKSGLSELEEKLKVRLQKELQSNGDSGHDMAHIRRVVTAAKKIGKEERADAEVVVPAAWLHDCVIISKDDPRRKEASKLAAERAKELLAEEGYSGKKLYEIGHAIEAHSFSAGIPPETIEAKVVQDADRLDAIGAIGIARCYAIGGQMGASIHHPEEPFPQNRPPDDRKWITDHFFTKLLKLENQFQTEAGRREAKQRTKFMQQFLDQLKAETG